MAHTQQEEKHYFIIICCCSVVVVKESFGKCVLLDGWVTSAAAQKER